MYLMVSLLKAIDVRALNWGILRFVKEDCLALVVDADVMKNMRLQRRLLGRHDMRWWKISTVKCGKL